MNATLHELACTGPTPAKGCVCATVPRRRPPAVERHLDAAAVHRDRAESLVRGMEVLARKFAALEAVPLDVVDRLERLIVQAHAANLLRLPQYRELGGDE